MAQDMVKKKFVVYVNYSLKQDGVYTLSHWDVITTTYVIIKYFSTRE
jgi:hypothetical protein